MIELGLQSTPKPPTNLFYTTLNPSDLQSYRILTNCYEYLAIIPQYSVLEYFLVFYYYCLRLINSFSRKQNKACRQLGKDYKKPKVSHTPVELI